MMHIGYSLVELLALYRPSSLPSQLFLPSSDMRGCWLFDRFYPYEVR